MITSLVNSLITRFSDFFEWPPSINEDTLATYFHPCYTLRWISNEYEYEKNRIQNLCINSADNIFNNDVTKILITQILAMKMTKISYDNF